MNDEDIAHIAVRLPHEAAIRYLDMALEERGYRGSFREDSCHFYDTVPNWDSPFDPPPNSRCLMILAEQDGWTTITDDLDRLDVSLALSLSNFAPVITVRGYFELQQFEYQMLINGNQIAPEDVNKDLSMVFRAIKSHSGHVTRFPYDKIIERIAHDRGRKLTDLYRKRDVIMIRGYIL